MNSRDSILASIRQTQVADAPLPAHDGPWIAYPDRVRQFSEVLSGVGGRAVEVADLAAAREAIVALAPMSDARQIVCSVPGLEHLGNFDVATVQEPKALAGVDVAILPGQFAVAENAAVWVDDLGLRHRAIYFLTQHLVLVVPRAKMVDHLHQAYERLQFDEPRYGVFISGPSKTADIEQSLVIGAHGPRSLTVLLLGSV
jgi:L-lactate dehydrogenase complex protein LldG